MTDIYYIDRITKEERKEIVYGETFIKALYGNTWFSLLFSFFFLPLICKVPFFSKLYGAFQRSSLSKRKIYPFIEKFQIDTSEFLDHADSFRSFDEFFIRKLKLSARPFAQGNDVAIFPADGRYLLYPHIQKSDGFVVKGKKFCLEELIGDPELAQNYSQGSMVLARLCPVDYHRFHFPVNCVPDKPKLINGSLFSVNPLALKKNIHILSRNKRILTKLNTKSFGTILYIEIGATYVGTIHETFFPGEPYAKGDEKGYFSFGGSSLILLFEPFKIEFDQDLLDASKRKIEIRGLFGQSLGRALTPL